VPQRAVVVFNLVTFLHAQLKLGIQKTGITTSAKFGFFLRSEGSKTPPGIIVHYMRLKYTANVGKIKYKTILGCDVKNICKKERDSRDIGKKFESWNCMKSN
jgi:hypothetical protein